MIRSNFMNSGASWLRLLFGAVIGVLTSLGLASCFSNGESVEAGSSLVTIGNPGDPGNTVCDPLSGSNPTAPDQGLYSQLYYLNEDEPPLYSAQDYVDGAHAAGLDLFFSELNVPTRMFNQGFFTQSGVPLTTPGGNTLYEYFGLHFESVIQLGPNDPAGQYQFALLSDDGSIMRINAGGGAAGGGPYTDFLNNDGVHPSKFKCAQSHLDFSASTRLPVELVYYQGPRYHISLMLLWRKLTPEQLQSSNPYAHAACDQSSNTAFFDPATAPPTPTAGWNQILADGWKVLGPENFKLPAAAPRNPCTGTGGGCTGIGCGGGGIGI